MEKSLLLVDDEKNILRSLRRLLRSDGYTIHTASSGKEGLEILKEHKICVILSDMRMPEMSGAEFLAKVKEQYPKVVRLMLSGYTDINSVTDAVNQGAIFKFLTKPWEDDEIKLCINEAFSQYQKNYGDTDFEPRSEKDSSDLISKPNKINQINERVNCESVLEQLPVAVIVIDNTGNIQFINDCAQRLLSIESTVLNSAPASAVIPQEILDLYRNSIENSQSIALVLENGISVDIRRSRKQTFQGEEASIITLYKR